MKQCTQKDWIRTTEIDSFYDSLKSLLKFNCQYSNVEIENDTVRADFSVFTMEYYIDRTNQLPPYVLLKNNTYARGNAYEYYAIAYEENKLYIKELQAILADKMIRFLFEKFKTQVKMLFYNNMAVSIVVNKPERKALYQWQKCQNELIHKIKKINENETQEEITNSIEEFIDGKQQVIVTKKLVKRSIPDVEVRELKELLFQFKKVNELLEDICITHIKLMQELNRKAETLMREDRQ